MNENKQCQCQSDVLWTAWEQKKKKNNSNNNEDSEYSEFILTVNRKKSVYFKQYFLLCVCVCTREVRPIVSCVYCAYFARFILLSIKIWTKAIRLYSSNGSQHWRNMYVCMRKKTREYDKNFVNDIACIYITSWHGRSKIICQIRHTFWVVMPLLTQYRRFSLYFFFLITTAFYVELRWEYKMCQ